MFNISTIWLTSDHSDIHYTLHRPPCVIMLFIYSTYFFSFYVFYSIWCTSRSSHQKCSIEKVFLKISQNSQENTCVRASFLTKLQALGLELYCILQNTSGRLLLHFFSTIGRTRICWKCNICYSMMVTESNFISITDIKILSQSLT